MTIPAGYRPRFGMPIVAPPPAGTAPAGHYATVSGRLSSWHVGSIAHHGVRVRFSSATAADSTIFAMVGGLATFIPAGQPLPTAGREASPGAGSIVLTTWAGDFPRLRRSLPPNVPPPAKVIYGNVSAGAFRAAMAPHVAAMPLPALEHFWSLTHPSNAPSRAALDSHFLDRALLGQAAVFVTGRDPLGNAEPDPAAAASGAPTQLELRFLDSGGADLSPVLHLRSMPQWAGAEWTGHPLGASVRQFPVPVNLYAAFEVYNLGARRFDRLPAGVSVELRDYDPVGPNDLEATVTTDAQGMVHFTFPDLTSIADSDLFFNVLTAGRSHAGHTLPAEWSTKGWNAIDGSPGYYEDFTGSQLGDAAHPLVFRIGVDFHARLRYTQYAPTYSGGRPGPPRLVGSRTAPPGVPVSFVTGRPDDFRETRLRTDEHGEIHGVSFQHRGGHDAWWGVDLEIEDATRNLLLATADPSRPPYEGEDPKAAHFDSRAPGPSHILYAGNRRTSIGSQAAPVTVELRADKYNTGLFFLRTWREISVLLWHLTGSSWPGVANLRFFFDTIGGNSYSWPVGEVNIDDTQLWERGTVVHELAHQLMWREASFSSWSIATSVLNLCGGLHLYHNANYLRNEEHALIEGWAEFVELLFVSSTSRFSVATLDDGSSLYTGANKGERVEGAFANALLDVTRDLVMPAGAAGSVPDVDNGNVDTTAAWITSSAAQTAFQSMIWSPLRDLSSSSTKTTTRFVENMRTRNLAEWHRIRRRMANWNLASGPATVSSVTPAAGPAAGGQAITLRGADFMHGSTVEIGGVAATSVVVNAHDTITAVTGAGTAGRRDVVVVNPSPAPAASVSGARATLAGGYEYQ